MSVDSDGTYQPLHRSSPGWVTTDGDLAARVGEQLGLGLDAEQRWLLDEIYGRDAAGRPSSFEVAVCGPRQTTGKSAAYAVAAIADVLVFGVPLVVWTAHETKTSDRAFRDMRDRLRRSVFAGRVDFREANGQQAIIGDTGRIEFHARSTGSGRGFTADRVVLDEALILAPGDLGALAPTLVTVPDAQVRYASSAGLPRSATWRTVRDRGRLGASRLAYVEHGAPRESCALERCTHSLGTPGCALDRVDLWMRANPALWTGRVSVEAVAQQRQLLPPMEFAREFMSWWEDPVTSSGGALDVGVWGSLADPDASRGSPVAFGADLDERRIGSVAVAWRRPDGAVQVMLTRSRAGLDVGLSREEMARRLIELGTRWSGPVALGGPAAAISDDLRRAGGVVEVMTGAQFAAASGLIADLLAARNLRHGHQQALNDSVAAAVWRPAGAEGARAFLLRGQPLIGPLAAVARAVWLLLQRPAGPPIGPVVVPVDRSDPTLSQVLAGVL